MTSCSVSFEFLDREDKYILEEESALGHRVVAEDEEHEFEEDPELVDVHAEVAEQGVDEAEAVEE